MISTKTFSLLQKEVCQPIECLTEKLAKYASEAAVTFDKVKIGKANTPEENFLREVYTFKDAEGKILKKVTTGLENSDSFVKERKYNELEDNARYICTDTLKNGRLTSKTEETIKLTVANGRNYIGRTIIEKFFNKNGSSRDRHFIGNFTNGFNLSKLEYFLKRDKKGIISDAPKITKLDLLKGQSMDLNNPYWITFFNTNKKDIINDLTLIECKRRGLKQLPDIIPHKSVLEKNTKGNICPASMSTYGRNWEFRGIKPSQKQYLIKPQLEVYTGSSKLEIVEHISHEIKHLEQDKNSMVYGYLRPAKNKIAKKFWDTELSGCKEPTQGSVLDKRYKQYRTEASVKLTRKHLNHEEYMNQLVEKEAYKAGEKTVNYYSKKLCEENNSFVETFPFVAWDKLVS